METPLVPENVRPGELKSLLVFDRFDCSVEMYDQDPTSTNFGKPAMYRIQSRLLDGPMNVHPTRILRFDGKKSINSDGWSGAYDRQWGVSEIIAAVTEIQHDSTFATSIAHLSQEASIPTVKVNNFREALMSRQGPGRAQRGRARCPVQPAQEHVPHALPGQDGRVRAGGRQLRRVCRGHGQAGPARGCHGGHTCHTLPLPAAGGHERDRASRT